MDQENKPKSFRMQKQTAKQYALTSLISGLIGIFLLPIFLGPVALLSGIGALIKSKKESLSAKEKIFAVIGIILSIFIILSLTKKLLVIWE